jgi:hypothetical protein
MVRTVTRGFDRQNQLAALLVLANISLYGGEQAGLVVWAGMIQAKNVRRIDGPLFESRAA